MWQTFGHDGIKHVLQRQLGAGSFAHAYLFAGPEGVGKKMLAMEFAGKILGTHEPRVHPDFQLFEPQGEVSVETVRDFIGKTGYKPFAASRTVFIFDGCERLNVQSSNALLKTLEEPSPSSIFILISASQKLLPTILSRCQIFTFNAFSESELTAFARGQGLEGGADLVSLSGGSTSSLVAMHKDRELAEQWRSAAVRFSELCRSRPEDKLMAVSSYAELETEELRRLVTFWLSREKKTLGAEPGRIISVRALWSALMDLNTNKNKKLILQRLFLSI